MQKAHQLTAHGRPLMGCCISIDNLPYEKIGKNEPVCIADEVPFEIPDSWEWVRLGNIFQHNTGKALNSSNHAGKLMEYITTSNLYWDHFEIDKLRSMLFTDAEIEKCTAIKGDLLVCEGGDIGRAAIWNFNYDIRIQNHIHRLRAYLPVCTEYFYYLFYLYKHAGWIGGKGIGIQGLSSNALHAVLFPFPPLEEQKRIVEKIVELQPYLNRYEEASSNAEKLNLEFPDQLKKSILQYAVQGKLVSQDPNDESASVLLERIQAEKEQLIKAGKIKRDKHESVIVRRDNSYYEKVDGIEQCIDDEIPFDIPDSWAWIRIKHAGIVMTGNTPSKSHPEYFGKDMPFISPGDIQNSKICSPNQGLSVEGVPFGRIVDANSILQVCIGGSIGKAAVCDYTVAFNQQLNSLTPIMCNSRYLLSCLSSFYFVASMKEKAGGTATPIINKSTWESVLIPLPSLNEQQRIVEKLDCIFAKLK